MYKLYLFLLDREAAGSLLSGFASYDAVKRIDVTYKRIAVTITFKKS
jgi:hypothetical protein